MTKSINKDYFKNKTYLITGFNRGIGKETAEILLNLDCKLILLGKSNKAFKGINLKNKIDFFKIDLSKINKIENILKKIKKKYKKINGIIHSAGLNQIKKIKKISLKDWNEVFSINITSIFCICKLLEKNLENSKNSSIVLVSSIAGHRKSLVSGIHYVSSKSALIGFSKQLSHEFGSKNIRVNCVAPSQTMTDMLKNSMTNKQQKNLKKQIPLKRLAQPIEQANVILFLLSDKASYITGTCINVDGGQI